MGLENDYIQNQMSKQFDFSNQMPTRNPVVVNVPSRKQQRNRT